jgi:hypothetical protein
MLFTEGSKLLMGWYYRASGGGSVMLTASKLSIFRGRRAFAAITLLSLSACLFATPYVWPKLIAGPTAIEATSTTTIALREPIPPHGKPSRLADSEDLLPLTGAWFVAEPTHSDPPANEEQVLSIDIKYPRSMRLNETPTVDFTLSAEEGSYIRNLFIKLSSAGFKIDPETPLELNSDVLPIRQTWTISPNSEGKHTLVLSVSKPSAVGFAQLNNQPVRPEQTFKLPVTVYTIYGFPLWMVNTLGAVAALGGTAVAWGPLAAWLYRRKSPASPRKRKQTPQSRRGK